MNSPQRLGPFELGECIGKGGMGEVFRAVHTTTGMPVAVKVILGQPDADSRQAFHREIQSHAGLTHPGVVYLFDYGIIEEDSLVNGAGGFAVHSPYVVMELADYGTISDQMPLRDFKDVRRILSQVLEALAFSHARGVIHKDLKPDNLLDFEASHTERQVKIADFGLAHAFHSVLEQTEQELGQVSGTPLYMTPEQIHGHWRTYGPWTDLYSLGCIVWHLVCGEPAFTGNSFYALAIQHCSRERPSLEPQFWVPTGLDAWVSRAMALDPRDRFQSAADALWALDELCVEAPEEYDETTADVQVPEALAKTQPLSKEKKGDEETLVFAKTLQMDTGGRSEDKREMLTPEITRPPFPSSWRTSRTKQLPTQLLGTGLGLFGLRDIPFVDRDRERDTIWEALHDVVENKELRVVFVAGESGAGKSRLVQWMSTRAQESGAAEVLYALHSRGAEGRTEGFPGLVQRQFHTWNLPRSEVYEFLLERLPALDDDDSFREVDARALTELVHPTDDNATAVDGPRYQFSNARQKQALMVRLLSRFTRRRTPILWLDDLHYAPEFLGFLQYIVNLPDHRPPALILATLRSDVLSEKPETSSVVEKLVENERCLRIDLDSVEPKDHRELVDLLLPLDPQLATTLAKRTEGNPLFAHQLLSSWITENNLERGDTGFQVARGETPALPDDIHQLWRERIRRLVASYPAALKEVVEPAIEIAAALGREVNDGEWRAACSDERASIYPTIVDRLIERGLALRTDEGWAFTHGLLVDSLKRSAQESMRWTLHHRRCALMLEKRYPDNLTHTARRRAEHWIEAQELERALPLLLEARKRYGALGEPAREKDCLRLHQTLLDRIGVPSADRRRLENELFRIDLLHWEAKNEEALRGVEDILERCQNLGDHKLLIKAYERHATYVRRIGDIRRAKEESQKALELSLASPDNYWLGDVLFGLGRLYFYSGQLEEADQYYRRAKEYYSADGAIYDALFCDAQLGWVQVSQGKHEKARATFETVEQQAIEQGFRYLESNCLNGLGDLARLSGRLEEARRYCTRCRHLDAEVGDLEGDLVWLANLAQIELAAKDFPKTRALLEQAQSMAEKMSANWIVEVLECIDLTLSCAAGDWFSFEASFESYAKGWPEGRPLFPDHPWILELAASFAREQNAGDYADKILNLVEALWEKLGDTEALERVRSARKDA